MLAIILLLSLSLYYAVVYSLSDEVDPDWSMFNLAVFCGSRYGKDFVDCKSPAIHLWYWVIGKVVGANIRRVKFAHHLLINLLSLPIATNGGIGASLVYLVMVNSGWLLAFHGNVGQLPAGLIALSLLSNNPWIACFLFALAVFMDPKLLPVFGIMVLVYGWWLPGLAVAALGALSVALLQCCERGKILLSYIFEATVVIPSRMTKDRKGRYKWVPWFTSQGFLYIMPWVFAAVFSTGQPWVFWIAPIAFAIITGMGRVVRANHLIPLAGWLAAANIEPYWILALSFTDWVSAGLYLGNIWARHYPGLHEMNILAKTAGDYLRDKTGIIWVNGLHTGVYIYAGKKIPYGMAEQIEIREVAHERRKAMVAAFHANPPDFVLQTDTPNIAFDTSEYHRVAVLPLLGWHILERDNSLHLRRN